MTKGSVKGSARAQDKSGQNEQNVKFHTAYLYYFKYQPKKVSVYELYSGFEDPFPQSPEEIAVAMAVNAAMNGKNPPKYGEIVDHLVRRRKGYVIFAVEGHTFNNSAIEFKRRSFRYKGQKDDEDDLGGANGNYTFKPVGQPFEIKVAAKTIGIAIYACDMKKKNGAELVKGEWEDFKASFSIAGRALPLEEDGGTNMGPPPPPPSSRRKSDGAGQSSSVAGAPASGK